MLIKQYGKSIFFALTSGVLVWWSLSPRVFSRAYEYALMPRVQRDERSVAAHGDPRVKSLSFLCRDKHSLPGLFYQTSNSDCKKVIIFFAGRSSNLGKVFAAAQQMLRLGPSVFVFEYAGFGNTPGRTSSRALMEDGLAAYDAVADLGYEANDIIIYGESLGTAVASYVAARRPAAGLVLQSGFSSLHRLARDINPIFRVYTPWMFSQLRMASDESLKRGHPPLLVMHGDNDKVISYAHSLRLAEAAGERTTLVILKGAGHFEVQERDDWHSAMRQFLDWL